MAHLITSVQNVLESPNANIDINVPIMPIISTGFRPILSDKRLHWNTVSASVAKNKDSYESMLALVSGALPERVFVLTIMPA